MTQQPFIAKAKLIEHTGLTSRELDAMMKKGMPVYKVGTVIMFLESEVMSFIKSHKVKIGNGARETRRMLELRTHGNFR